jgi:hypothetical protein
MLEIRRLDDDVRFHASHRRHPMEAGTGTLRHSSTPQGRSDEREGD